MKLIIGGYSQGKLNYTLRKIGEKEYRICDGTLPEYTKIDTAEINIIKSDIIFIRSSKPQCSGERTQKRASWILSQNIPTVF